MDTSCDSFQRSHATRTGGTPVSRAAVKNLGCLKMSRFVSLGRRGDATTMLATLRHPLKHGGTDMPKTVTRSKKMSKSSKTAPKVSKAAKPSKPSSKAKSLPPRSKVRPQDTWDLQAMFPSDADWEAA